MQTRPWLRLGSIDKEDPYFVGLVSTTPSDEVRIVISVVVLVLLCVCIQLGLHNDTLLTVPLDLWHSEVTKPATLSSTIDASVHDGYFICPCRCH